MMKLQDKVAIITGGAGGVGKGIALAMAKEGAKVVIVDVNEDAGNETIAELKKHSDAHLIISDISKRENLTKIVEEALKMDNLIRAAGNNSSTSRIKDKLLGDKRVTVGYVLDHPDKFNDATGKYIRSEGAVTEKSTIDILREIEEKSEQRRETWAEKRVLRPIK